MDPLKRYKSLFLFHPSSFEAQLEWDLPRLLHRAVSCCFEFCDDMLGLILCLVFCRAVEHWSVHTKEIIECHVLRYVSTNPPNVFNFQKIIFSTNSRKIKSSDAAIQDFSSREFFGWNFSCEHFIPFRTFLPSASQSFYVFEKKIFSMSLCKRRLCIGIFLSTYFRIYDIRQKKINFFESYDFIARRAFYEIY